jgi:hypothetical protein
MIRTSFALLLTTVLAFGITGCRAERAAHQHHGGGGGGSLLPAPDPSFGGHMDGPPMLPPAASIGQRLRGTTVSKNLRTNPFRRATQTRIGSPGLMATPENALPEAISAPTLW